MSRVDFLDVPEYWEAPLCTRLGPGNATSPFTEVPYRPEYLDDAQLLASVPSEAYDVVIACHVIEHVTRPLVALGNWIRVLKPGGILLLVAPDPCERTLMDRYRLAAPGSHHLRDYYARDAPAVPPPEHATEMVVSTYRLLELLHILKDRTLQGTSALEEVRNRLSLPASTPFDELRDMIAHIAGAKDREGHVHVWSRDTLRDTLRHAEDLFQVVALVAETAASHAPRGSLRRFQEYRVALGKGDKGLYADLFAKQWCHQANESYIRAKRHSSPILIGDIDVDLHDVPFRGTTPVVCKNLVRAVRTWEACAVAATKADRHDCMHRAAEQAAFLSMASSARANAAAAAPSAGARDLPATKGA